MTTTHPSATRSNRPPKPIQPRMLRVAINRHGRTVRYVSLPDPRGQFIRDYNERNTGTKAAYAEAADEIPLYEVRQSGQVLFRSLERIQAEGFLNVYPGEAGVVKRAAVIRDDYAISRQEREDTDRAEKWTIALQEDDSPPDQVFQADNPGSILSWLAMWLRGDTYGMKIIIVPPELFGLVEAAERGAA